MTDKTGLNVAIYARVSTRDKGQDCENQLRELREYVNRRLTRAVGCFSKRR